MLARTGRCLSILAVLLLVSCAQLPRVLPQGEGGVATEALKSLTSVPPEWGNLISVTTTTTRDNVTQYIQLWFQDAGGTVRVVAFDPQSNQFMPNAWLFPRK